VVILLNLACLEAIAAKQNHLNYGFDKVQLRIYNTDKLAADNLSCACYDPISNDDRLATGKVDVVLIQEP